MQEVKCLIQMGVVCGGVWEAGSAAENGAGAGGRAIQAKVKIQGDAQKFVDRFKLFWVTSIITIIQVDPYLPITAKIRNKRCVFFSYIFVFISSSQRMLPFDI